MAATNRRGYTRWGAVALAGILLLVWFVALSDATVVGQVLRPKPWEHKVLRGAGGDYPNIAVLEKQLNKIGGQGWELVAVRADLYFFKRR